MGSLPYGIIKEAYPKGWASFMGTSKFKQTVYLKRAGM